MITRLSNLIIVITNAALAIISFFIGARLILRFFSANPATPIVAWIYEVSGILISPFRGIFPDLATQTGVFDMVAVISLVAYLILGYLLGWLLANIANTAETGRTISERSDLAHAKAHYHDLDEDLEEEEEETTTHHHRHSR